MNSRRFFAAFVAAIQLCACARGADSDQSKINTAVEALLKLDARTFEEKPAIKAAATRLLDKTRGTPNFIRLARHFDLKGESQGIVEAAVRNPDAEESVDGIRFVLAGGDPAALKSALEGTNAAAAARLLGSTREKSVVPLLVNVLVDERRDPSTRRSAARALAQSREGAAALLGLSREDKIPDAARFAVATDLNAARWPDIKAEAAKLLPLPAAQNAQPLPPLAELVKMKGDVAKGAEVFRRETTGCIKCHQVRGEGRDVGPALTEIGSKLAREALYEAILDPSAGISFGFEAWQVQLKSGDEVFGLKASETPDEVAIKDTNGLITHYKRSEIASMQQGRTSIMPAGLQATMTSQDLADLVEYLVSLKKPTP